MDNDRKHDVGALIPPSALATLGSFKPILERADKLISIAQGMKYAMIGLAVAFGVHSIVAIATRPSPRRR